MKKERFKEIQELQNILGVKFNNKNLIDTAVTHSSYANEGRNIISNERLEFLGDSILQLCISELLYEKYSHEPEGFLTKKRALIVCGNSLFHVSQRWNLGKYINMSKGEEMTGGRSRISILADCVEAIIASIYLDQGYNSAKKFILSNFAEIIEKADKGEIVSDYKTKLQETVQKLGEYNIEYNLVDYEGPAHRRKFFSEVKINTNIKGSGQGYSKKESEQNAAKQALVELEDKYE